MLNIEWSQQARVHLDIKINLTIERRQRKAQKINLKSK